MNKKKSLRHVAMVDEFLDLRKTWSCIFFRSADKPKSINVELFQYSDGVMRGSVRGRNQPKDGRCPDYIRKPPTASQSMQTGERKRLSKKFNDSHFVIDFFRNLKTFKIIMANLSWHVLFHQKMSHLKVSRRGRTFVTFKRNFFFSGCFLSQLYKLRL